MASDLPEDDLRRPDEPSVLPNDDGNGLSEGAIRTQIFPTLAPCFNLSRGLLITLVFVGDVVLATLAWIIVGIVMR
jgi:hypothetical protein